VHLGRLLFAVAASAAIWSAAAGVAAAAEPAARIEGELPAALKTQIVAAIGDVDRPAQNRFEARRRARDAAEDAIAVLRSQGFYAYDVEPDVDGGATEGETPAPIIRVKTGPQFQIRRPSVTWLAPEPDAPAAEAGVKAMGLVDGQPGRAAEVIAAEGRVVAAVQKRGYADAAADPREVVVDHADQSVSPNFRVRSGALVRLNGVEMTTNGRTRAAWVRKLAPWTSGDVYDPDDVAELERRLLDAAVFDSVTVALAPLEKITADGLRPVIVSLAERKGRTIELGASYATTEGTGLDARWTRYNALGRADTLSIFGRLSDLDSRAGVDVSLPHWRRPDQTLKGTAQGYDVRTDAYDETGVGVRLDVQRRFTKTSYITIGASTDLSRTQEIRVRTLQPLGRDLVTIGLLADAALDRSNDPLDPKRGWRLNLRGEPTVIFGRQANVPYLKVTSQGTYYQPLTRQASTVIAGRLKLGSILNGGIPTIPAPRRFYAGGGGSVRGFGYQAVGPRLDDVDDTPLGGLSLMEASVELRQALTERWGFAAFVDAGAIGTNRFPTVKDLSVGAGLGVRYNLGFGPIRIDVATPVNNRKGRAPFQLYVSIGQSF
jgi:translocation and assembly module TamA